MLLMNHWRTMGSARYMDKEWLHNQYVIQERSVTDIAEDCKVTRNTIISWLDEYSIYRNWRRAIDKKNKK